MLTTKAYPFSWTLALVLLLLGQHSSANENDTPIEIAAYYYPWYVPHHPWSQGYLREKLDPPQEPLLGEYNMQHAEIVTQHAQWANQYGISQFICSW